MARIQWMVAIALLAGCQQAPPSTPAPGGIGRLPDERVAETAPVGHLAVSIQEAPAAFRLAYTRVPDWDQAVISLSNSTGTPATATQTIAATVDASTLVRTASATFTGLAPKGGYSLSIALQKRNASGAGFTTLASGSRSDFSVALGANTINVGLALASGSGQVSLTVPQPSLP